MILQPPKMMALLVTPLERKKNLYILLLHPQRGWFDLLCSSIFLSFPVLQGYFLPAKICKEKQHKPCSFGGRASPAALIIFGWEKGERQRHC